MTAMPTFSEQYQQVGRGFLFRLTTETPSDAFLDYLLIIFLRKGPNFSESHAVYFEQGYIYTTVTILYYLLPSTLTPKSYALIVHIY